MSILNPNIMSFPVGPKRGPFAGGSGYVKPVLNITDIFNGFDLNGYTVSGGSVVPDETGALRITTAGSLACEGGYFDEATSTWKEPAGTTKKTIRTTTGSKVVYADTDPTAWPRATVNPTRTNKCTCRKINPVDTTNVTKSGDAAAVLSVVDDTAALAAAGLDKLCTSGKVYKLDNNLGIDIAWVGPAGTHGNVNVHSQSVYVRGGTGKLIQGDFSTLSAFSASVNFVLIKAENYTPSSLDNRIYLVADPGQTIYFILPQLEEGTFATDPIIAPADPLAAITRTGTSITKPTAGLFPMVSETAAQNFGIYMRVIPKASGQGAAILLSLYNSFNDRLFLRAPTDNSITWARTTGGTGKTISISTSILDGNPMDMLCLQTDAGMGFKIRTFLGGSWSAWSSWQSISTGIAGDPFVMSSRLDIGMQNDITQFYANYLLCAILKLGDQATLADYQAVAELGVDKINA